MNLLFGDQVSDISECRHNATAEQQRGCWHKSNTVRLVFRNGDVWLLNAAGYAQLYRTDQIKRRR